MTLDTMLKIFCRRVSLNGKDLKQDRVSVGVANSEPAIVTQGSGAMGAAKALATRKRTNWRNMKVSLGQRNLVQVGVGERIPVFKHFKR